MCIACTEMFSISYYAAKTCSNVCAKQSRMRRQVHCNKQPPQSHLCPAGTVFSVRRDTENHILSTQTIVQL